MDEDMADIYEDARLYDALGAGHFSGSDRTYWHQQCARYGGPILELACGSGRLTVPLAEEGVDIEGLDISPTMLALLTRSPSARFPAGKFLHPDTGEPVVVTETAAYDAATQINQIRWFWRFADGHETVSDLPMWVYCPQELDALLSCAGFIIEEKYGGYDLSPFTSASQKQLIIVRPV